MSKKNKNFIAALIFFSILITISLLWWNVAISQIWLSRIASIDEIQWALKNNEGKVNAKDSSGWTGLMIAAELADVDRTRALLQYKADPNIVSADLNKGTALHMICRKSLITDRGIEVMKLLLEHGANPNIQDATGKTPLHWIGGFSDAGCRTQVLNLLVKHGASFNVTDVFGDTPLNTMIDFLWSRDPSWFKNAILIPYGDKIDPSIKNKRGETTLGFAKARKYIPIVQALCSTGKWACTTEERTGFVE